MIEYILTFIFKMVWSHVTRKANTTGNCCWFLTETNFSPTIFGANLTTKFSMVATVTVVPGFRLQDREHWGANWVQKTRREIVTNTPTTKWTFVLKKMVKDVSYISKSENPWSCWVVRTARMVCYPTCARSCPLFIRDLRCGVPVLYISLV